MQAELIETLIIGGGQAGLITSYRLKQHSREHLVLEKADRPASAWSQRWDSFTLVTPNWAFLPSGKESLTKSDAFAAMLLDAIDGYVAKTGLDAPGERPPVLRDGYDADAITELDLARAGITTLIWAAGYDFDFDLVKLPVTDEYGFPLQQRGVTTYPGLYFVGLPWLHTQQSGLLMGVSDDAAFIAAQIVNG